MKTWIGSLMPGLFKSLVKDKPILQKQETCILYFILLGVCFLHSKAAGSTWHQDPWQKPGDYYQQCRQSQQNILSDIIKAGEKHNSVLYKHYLIFQKEGDKTARGQMADLMMQRQLSSVHKSYLRFTNEIRRGAADGCIFDQNIKDIVEFNLQLLEDMIQHPNTYNLLEITLEEVWDIKGPFKPFQKLRGCRK